MKEPLQMDAKTIEAITTAINRPAQFDFEEHKVLLLPPGYTLRDVSDLMPPPPRIVQDVEVFSPEDFCSYVKRHALSAAVFADETKGTFDGVMDYHLPAAVGVTDKIKGRGPLDHVVVYNCPFSDEWKIWTGASSKTMNQADFARFVEENIPDIITPPAADMLQLALNIEIHKGAKFESELNLGSGQRQLKYVETIQGVAKPGTIAIPASFRISIPVFAGGEQFGIDARFRYRMNDGNLALWYELVRINEVQRKAVGKVTETIRAGLPDDVPLWRGKRVQ